MGLLFGAGQRGGRVAVARANEFGVRVLGIEQHCQNRLQLVGSRAYLIRIRLRRTRPLPATASPVAEAGGRPARDGLPSDRANFSRPRSRRHKRGRSPNRCERVDAAIAAPPLAAALRFVHARQGRGPLHALVHSSAGQFRRYVHVCRSFLTVRALFS